MIVQTQTQTGRSGEVDIVVAENILNGADASKTEKTVWFTQCEGVNPFTLGEPDQRRIKETRGSPKEDKSDVYADAGSLLSCVIYSARLSSSVHNDVTLASFILL
jgi:hypothetical protein